MLGHSRVLRLQADQEDGLAREILAARKRGDLGGGNRGPSHMTQAARTCKIRAEALRRLAVEAEQREQRPKEQIMEGMYAEARRLTDAADEIALSLREQPHGE